MSSIRAYASRYSPTSCCSSAACSLAIPPPSLLYSTRCLIACVTMLPQTFAPRRRMARRAPAPEESIVAVEIVMPRLSDSMEEGAILQWLVAEGAQVAEGEPLVEVETDKASVTYESEHDGTLLSIRAQPGESVAVGAVIAV